ncbi:MULTISPECIES: cysteine desulfurase family protein [Mammaliicoccus]|uniref:cysteine desulfurase family protein n=1 Tax=Mammaliicoccus TaxID=2803850 RepID=UPI000CCFE686|nr:MULTISPECIES: cysteine desulfurase family protein [Mammaliicoccus]HBV03755.1 cysteine desulfurase [Staphylococcus sp.]MDQ7141862.1 cysteine desulfurase family protein [Mammaliicoccus lentus]POA06425.1 cysteine desulfurase NifS [Mammaliicoccus lentus]WHI55829.1 cysteine desulfurase family protein [Mammaliicoccus lentus]WHI58350.1 cysteine desulfurase family protein [Mammaliicoccus lentus]
MKVYADYAATTPVKPVVTEKITEILSEHYGNPSSIHSIGRDGRKYLDQARRDIASVLGSQPNEIIFTSGATEANNTAIKGVARKKENKGKHIITSSIEHHSVLHVFEELEREGFEVTYLDVHPNGVVDLEHLKESIRPDTTLISIMLVNNEVGTVQPLYEIAEIIEGQEITFHVDAVQAIGHMPIDFNEMPMDMLSITAHKFGGPKGIGALLVKKDIQFNTFIQGGEQELKRRAGTENVPYICGMATAIIEANENMDYQNVHLMNLKQNLIVGLQQNAIPFELNGSMTDTTGHITNLYFPFIEVETMLTLLDMSNIYVSSGSACTAGSTLPSHVLQAMFGNEERTKKSVRFSFGLETTEEEINYIVSAIMKIYHQFKEEENE